MTKDEFISKAKQLGYSDAAIERIIKTHDRAAGEGIDIPWELDLIELPIENQFSKKKAGE